MRVIGSEISKKSNNLNLLKFIAAILVIFSHSFGLTGNGVDFLFTLTRGQLNFGGFAVSLFFFASGFYVTKGLLKRRKGILYLKNRLFRIYPAFIVVVIVTAFILGPTVSSFSVYEYFKFKEVYTYLLYLFMIPRYALPGVFETNPYAGVVNGSLWTLILEAMCYIGLYVIYKCGFLKQKKIKIIYVLIGIVSILFLGLKVGRIYQYHSYLRPLLVFFVGSCFYIMKDEIELELRKWIIALILTIILFIVQWGDVAVIFFFPYLFSGIIFAPKQVNDKGARLGNYSYGIYLSAFPIQQTLVQYINNITPYMNTLLTTVICVVIAIVIYHCVELPVAKLEKSKIQ